MALKLQNLIVIDIEASCWEDPVPGSDAERAGTRDEVGFIPAGQQREIIEIGVCLIELKTLDVSQRWSTLVRPAVAEISPYCTKLTSLTAARLEGAADFAGAIAALRMWLGTVRLAQQGVPMYGLPSAGPHATVDGAAEEMCRQPIASWGTFDRLLLERQCQRLGMAFPFSTTHFNLKALFPIFGRSNFTGRELSLRVALRTADVPETGTHHRAEDDAAHAAGVAVSMLKALRSREAGVAKAVAAAVIEDPADSDRA